MEEEEKKEMKTTVRSAPDGSDNKSSNCGSTLNHNIFILVTKVPGSKSLCMSEMVCTLSTIRVGL